MALPSLPDSAGPAPATGAGGVAEVEPRLPEAYRAYDSPLGCSLNRTLRQLERTAGLTQASRVTAPVRFSDAESLTVTRELVPLKARAPPNSPAVDQVVFFTTPVLPLPEAS